MVTLLCDMSPFSGLVIHICYDSGMGGLGKTGPDKDLDLVTSILNTLFQLLQL